MADNYVLFSEVIPKLSGEERAWARTVLKAGQDGDGVREWGGGPALRAVLAEAGVDLAELEADEWPAFEWEIDSATGDLWLYSAGEGDVGHAAAFARGLLARFRPRDVWTLTWAETCSRPRVGEFGGGAVFVGADSTEF